MGDGQPPPATIQVDESRGEDAYGLDGNCEHAYLTPLFQDTWGNLGLFAIEAARGGYRIPDGFELTDDILQLIATRLLAEPIAGDFYDEMPLWFVLANWTDRVDGFEPGSRIVTLRPLTPYLITLLEREEGALRSDVERDGAAYFNLSLALQNITGQYLESQYLASPAEWWAWWDGL